MIKPLCIAIGAAFAISSAALPVYAKDAKGRTASDARSSEKVTKTRRHKSSGLNVGRSDEPIVDQCRTLRGAPLALCLHEKRGDSYAEQWRAIVAGNPTFAAGGTGATGAAGPTGVTTSPRPNETQPGATAGQKASDR
ncbi:MAG: hypothetical protein JWN13_3574 [Betaproteobacteria bacterium]|jgi:hypothetical protein|nr:hypothetical protein [Betaproteobacteria bacterium]